MYAGVPTLGCVSGIVLPEQSILLYLWSWITQQETDMNEDQTQDQVEEIITEVRDVTGKMLDDDDDDDMGIERKIRKSSGKPRTGRPNAWWE
jgi:hypothetical protein